MNVGTRTPLVATEKVAAVAMAEESTAAEAVAGAATEEAMATVAMKMQRVRLSTRCTKSMPGTSIDTSAPTPS